MTRPGTVEAARLCAEEALTPLRGIDGLLTHPFTQGKRNMAAQRLRVALHALAGALASVETAELEPPFIGAAPLLPRRADDGGGGARSATEGAQGADNVLPLLQPRRQRSHR